MAVSNIPGPILFCLGCFSFFAFWGAAALVAGGGGAWGFMSGPMERPHWVQNRAPALSGPPQCGHCGRGSDLGAEVEGCGVSSDSEAPQPLQNLAPGLRAFPQWGQTSDGGFNGDTGGGGAIPFSGTGSDVRSAPQAVQNLAWGFSAT